MNPPEENAGVPLVYAVIPAAGRSRRMGEPKQLLPYGDRTILETVIENVLSSPMNGLAVVTNSDVANELDLQEDPRFLTVINDDPDTQMLDSIRLGIGGLQSELRPAGDSGIMVCPGDMPDIDATTLATCIAAFVDDPSGIVVATHDGKTGHPIVFPIGMVTELPGLTEGGLSQLLDKHADRICPAECACPGVTRDIDTPEDYDGSGTQ